MRCAHWLPFCSVTLVLAGCVAVPPTGPSVLALPTAGKNLAVFSQDDSSCRGYAQLQSGGRRSAAGHDTQHCRRFRPPGGSAAGASYGSMTTAELQQRYDISYAQCMTARGNTVGPPMYVEDYDTYAYTYPYWADYGP